MTRRNYSLIPVICAILVIPQLLFWWLAPLTAAARLIVYAGGTLITCAIGTTLFYTYWRSGLQRSAGLAVVTGGLEVLVIAVCATLLLLNVTIRSAIYALAIVGLINFACTFPLVNSILHPARVSVTPVPSMTDLGDFDTDDVPHTEAAGYRRPAVPVSPVSRSVPVTPVTPTTPVSRSTYSAPAAMVPPTTPVSRSTYSTPVAPTTPVSRSTCSTPVAPTTPVSPIDQFRSERVAPNVVTPPPLPPRNH